ncbi:MAG: GNAT family N-acetyltransferase [Pseudomonadota bacterium]
MTQMRCLQPPTGAAADAARRHVAPVPALETARLRLRPPTMRDLPLWTRIWTDPTGPNALSEEGAWENFCTYVAGWLLHGHGLWSVDEKGSGTLVGFVLLGLEWGDEAPELGWALSPDHRGHGYATEAATAARDHALALFGPGVAISYIAEGNAASARVAERLGATRRPNYDETTRVYGHGEIDEDSPQ